MITTRHHSWVPSVRHSAIRSMSPGKRPMAFFTSNRQQKAKGFLNASKIGNPPSVEC